MMDSPGPSNPSKKPKRQKLAEQFDDTVLLESVLIAYLMKRFVWRFISATEVQDISKLLREDLDSAIANTKQDKHAQFPQGDAMSEIGTSGKHPSNCHRGLLNNLQSIPVALANAISLWLEL